MTTNKESKKLRKILTDMGQEEKPKQKSRAGDILEKIKQREAADEEKRKVSEKFIDEFVKDNGKITYFKDQWFGTKVWRDAYDEGYQQAQWETEEEHKDMIYKLVQKLIA